MLRNHTWPVPALLVLLGLLVTFGGGIRAEEQVNETVVRGEGMVVRLLGNFPGDRKHDLAGVAVTAEFTIEGETLVGTGEIAKGTYQAKPGIKFSADLDLIDPFVYEKGDVKIRLGGQGSGVSVTVKKSALKKAVLSGAVEMEVAISGQEGPLTLVGEMSGGTYEPGQGVSHVGSITLAEDFEYSSGTVTATLASGGSLTVGVKKNRFKYASFLEVQGEVQVALLLHGDLKMTGPVGGKIDGAGIHIDATLTLVPPFEYTKDKVTVRMKSGSLGVQVKSNKLQKATVEVDAEMDVEVSEGSDLLLGGELGGVYENGGFDLTGNLGLREEFEYHRPSLRGSLRSGVVGVEVKKSGFKSAFLDVEAEVDVTIPKAPSLPLEGRLRGTWAKGETDLGGELTLRKEYTVVDGTSKTVLHGGTVGLRLKKGKLQPLEFSDLVYRVEIVVEGSGGKGEYDDGRFTFESEDLKNRGLKGLAVEPAGPTGPVSDE
ncbi:MAG: hypothetical protein ABFS86_07860 [Planctomycetota bacterium]